MAKAPSQAFHEKVAERIIKQLEQGTAPWQKPWDASQAMGYLPYNPTTGKRYKGANALWLMSEGRDDPRWLTYQQAQAVGAQVRKGAKGVSIQYWKFTDEIKKTDANGNPVLGEDGKPIKVLVKREKPSVFYATVFNAEHIDGLPSYEKTTPSWADHERAEHLLAASGANIMHVAGDSAYYRPATDTIVLPEKVQFNSPDRYLATALHELSHWSGHASRLNRDLAHPFGSVAYAKEELRAEISSLLMGEELGIGHDPEQHIAYVGAWIQVLKADPMEIIRAAADAEKIQAFLLAFEQVQDQTAIMNSSDAVIATDHETEEDTPYVPLTDSERSTLLTNATEQLAARTTQETAEQQQRLAEKLAALTLLTQPTDFMVEQAIPVQYGLLTDGNGHDVYVPLVDTSGKIRALVSLQADGSRQLERLGDKDGHFHWVGDVRQLETELTILITRDLASAHRLKEAVELPVAVALAAENMREVAHAIKAQFPEKNLIIAGEAGKDYASEIAEAVAGVAIHPVFAPGEQAAGLSTFHDLATQSRLGKAAVARQLKPLIGKVNGQSAVSKAKLSEGIDKQPETILNLKRGGRVA